MTKEQVVKRIRDKVRSCEGQTRAADSYGVTPQHLNDVLAGNRAPGPKLLKGMGLERVVTYKAVSR